MFTFDLDGTYLIFILRNWEQLTASRTTNDGRNALCFEWGHLKEEILDQPFANRIDVFYGWKWICPLGAPIPRKLTTDGPFNMALRRSSNDICKRN